MNNIISDIESLLELALPEQELTKTQTESLLNLSEELKSQAAIDSIKLDPYWPKWDSPWWKALLLYECGQKHLIPISFLDELIKVIDNHYLHYFPVTESELPKDIDPYREIMCFCALGNMYRVFEACGICVKDHLPWWYEWLVKYQLPDGGYNCDESAYSKSRKSSFLSTLPMLEAMLIVYKKTNDQNVKTNLDKGAQYLLDHQIYKSINGQIINEDWLKISFPRFYDYDILRGFTFLVEWAHLTNASIPVLLVDDCLKQIRKSLNSNGRVLIGENKIINEGSLYYIANQWIWKDKSTSFKALDYFSGINQASAPLTNTWINTLTHLPLIELVP